MALPQGLNPELGTGKKPSLIDSLTFVISLLSINALVEPQGGQHRVCVVCMPHKALWDACKFLWFELLRRRTAFCMQKLGRLFSLCAPEIICLVLLQPLVEVGQKTFVLTAWCLVLFSWWLVVAKITVIFFHFPLEFYLDTNELLKGGQAGSGKDHASVKCAGKFSRGGWGMMTHQRRWGEASPWIPNTWQEEPPTV